MNDGGISGRGGGLERRCLSSSKTCTRKINESKEIRFDRVYVRFRSSFINNQLSNSVLFDHFYQENLNTIQIRYHH